MSTETFEFQAETTQLLNLVINSLYTNKEIFLRELVSNASDALDRLRFEAITRPELAGDEHPYEIRLEHDAARRTLTVRDTGIGMSREEVVANLGTIAKSGTRELLAQVAEGASGEILSRLIGQFGVGFYSAFMVSDLVTVVTRRPGEATATRWESAGDGTFAVSETVRDRCGTTVTLQLKPEDVEAGIRDYADARVLEEIVKRYSDFITYPIMCKVERTEAEREADGTLKEGGRSTTVVEDRTLNAMKPIWTRPRSEVSDEEYAEFYRHVAHDWSEPLRTLSLKAEGRLEYRALLFIPSQAPLDLGLAAPASGLHLYAKQVLIMERCEELLEPYLRFVRGVVDSADLPLNVSRETLQQDRHIAQMRTWLTGRVIKDIEELAEGETDAYLKLWEQFGRTLKEGVAVDHANRDRLSRLLLFSSSNDSEDLTSLADYVGRMPSDQEHVFYLTGESRELVEHSPHLEAFVDQGIEVLYLTDPVDELVVEALKEFDGKPLQSAAKGAVELGSDEERQQAKERLQEQGEELDDLLTALQKHLDEHVREVRLSSRLRSSPACLVGSEQDVSPQLERLLRSSPYKMPRQKRILELNPEHDIVKRLQERHGDDAADPRLAEAADLLLGYALLAEGSELPDPARFNALLAELMSRGLEG